jgi:hypothetical protein
MNIPNNAAHPTSVTVTTPDRSHFTSPGTLQVVHVFLALRVAGLSVCSDVIRSYLVFNHQFNQMRIFAVTMQ